MTVIINGSGTANGITSFSSPANFQSTLSTASRGISAAALPSGTILQVVSNIYSTQTSTTSSSYSDTGLSASITPLSSTSKILILITQAAVSVASGNGQVALKLLRGSTDLYTWETSFLYMAGLANDRIAATSFNYIDSPATTSSTTYKTQFNATNSITSYVQRSSGVSSMVLLEIAQ